MPREISSRGDHRDRSDRFSGRREGNIIPLGGRDKDRDRDRDRQGRRPLRVEGEARGPLSRSESTGSASASESGGRGGGSLSSRTASGIKVVTQAAPSRPSAQSREKEVSRLKPPPKLEEPSPAPSGKKSVDKKVVYERVVKHENRKAKKLNAPAVVNKGREICRDLEQEFHGVLELLGNPSASSEDMERHVQNGLMKISSLRNTNRFLKLKLKSVKEGQLGVRNAVDSRHLLLQNLLYEATHLQNQVAAMQDYRGMDETIDLVPVEQFYELAPLTISKPDLTRSDPHMLRIARLEHEFVQRQKLTEDCKGLEKKMDVSSKTILETQEKLESIEPLLNSILEATKPVQQIFGIDISSKKQQNDISQYLPAELYVILIQSNGFKEAKGLGDNFMIYVRGNVEEAKELAVTPDEAEEESDSDKEQEPESETSRRRLMRKKSSIRLSRDDMRKKIAESHPLWIEWFLKREGGGGVCIQFHYIMKLRIVTVKAKTVEESRSTSQPEFLSSDSLLDGLFPDDRGLESPNPANGYLFQKVDAAGISEFISETGRPYMWAQKLAGLEFPSSHDIIPGDEVIVRPKMEISAASMGKVLKAIKSRMSNQTVLCQQLRLLETRNLQVPAEARQLFAPKIYTQLKSWEPISTSTFHSYSFVKDHVRTGATPSTHSFYRAVIERGKVSLTALVAVPCDFPMTPAIFAIQMEKDGERRNCMTDPAIRLLESDVNVHSITEFQEWPQYLLSLQMLLLTQSIDIILETDFGVVESAGPSEFGRDKLVLRLSAGRNQRRPFKYNGSGGGYFSQRY